MCPKSRGVLGLIPLYERPVFRGFQRSAAMAWNLAAMWPHCAGALWSRIFVSKWTCAIYMSREGRCAFFYRSSERDPKSCPKCSPHKIFRAV